MGPLPGIDAGTPSKVTIGGYNLAVSAYSKHPDLAFEAAMCLRSAEHQKFSAINDGVPPTIGSVYDDPEMLKAFPMKDEILTELQGAAVRPLTPAYRDVSTVVFTRLSAESPVTEGRSAKVWFDLDKVQLFDPENGRNLSLAKVG